MSLPDCRLRLPASSARSTVRSSFASDNGFFDEVEKRRGASPLLRFPPCRVPTSSPPGSRWSVVDDHSRSRMMPSTSGIQMSSSTRSGVCFARDRASLNGVGGDIHLITLFGEDLLEEGADVSLIIDDQDVCRYSCSLPTQLAASVSVCSKPTGCCLRSAAPRAPARRLRDDCRHRCVPRALQRFSSRWRGPRPVPLGLLVTYGSNTSGEQLTIEARAVITHGHYRISGIADPARAAWRLRAGGCATHRAPRARS